MGGKTEIALAAGGSPEVAGDGIRQCPRCHGRKIWRDGRRRTGKRGWRCGDCGKAFVDSRHGIPHEVRIIADRMIEEHIRPQVIAAILRGWVSRSWVYQRRKGWVHGADQKHS